MTTNEEIVKLQKSLITQDWGYKYVGIRIVDNDYDGYNAAVGDTLQPSHVWVDGEWTDDELGGTSAIGIDAQIEPVSYYGYMGRRVLVIGGDSRSWGEDVGEIIVHSAKVLAIIDLP